MAPPAEAKSEGLVLAGYAAIGALIAVAVIAVLLKTGALRGGSDRLLGEPAPSSSAAAAGSCALTANTEACNQCMNRLCRGPCETCAASGWCLRLYQCVLDCKDEACNRACEKRYPDGKLTLAAFAGTSGCMAKQCAEACK
ncbi:MAG: hypothetical protein HY898_24560 [Deltaproteobacteria bacterium]|nr:hypothetical protein [Deltaproteobacteria bacterium]